MKRERLSKSPAAWVPVALLQCKNTQCVMWDVPRDWSTWGCGGKGSRPSGGTDFLPPCNIWNLCGLCGKFGRPLREPMKLLYLNWPWGNVLGFEVECVCVFCRNTEVQSGSPDSMKLYVRKKLLFAFISSRLVNIYTQKETRGHEPVVCLVTNILVWDPKVVCLFLAHYFLNLLSAFLLSWQLSGGPTW